MAISAGSYTVGSGGDYATWKAAFDDMITQTADIALTQISDVSETAAVNIDHNCSGFNVYCYALTNHRGVYANALKTVYNFTGGTGLFILTGANANDTVRITFDRLAFFVQSATPDTTCILNPNTGLTNRNVNLSNCLFNLNGLDVGAFWAGGGFDSTVRHRVYNNKAWNKADSVTRYAFVNTGYGCIYENNTYYGTTGRGFALDGDNVEAYNNASYCPVGFGFSSGIGGLPTGRNNASSDGTADDAPTQSENHIHRSAATDFLSLDPSSINFLRPSLGGALGQNGRAAAISGNTAGIEGNARPSSEGYSSIGAHQYRFAQSLLVAGAAYNVRQWPKPIIEPAIQWIQDSSGNWNGSDRGADQDVYEAEVVFFDTEANIDALMATLEANREGLTLSAFATPIFSPEVDHTGSISATVISMGPRRHLAYASGGKGGVYDLPVTFRALSPTLLGTSPSLATLKLQEGFEGDASFEVGKAFTYSQASVYSDHGSDVGRFVGTCRQQTSQIQAILAYLLVTARAASVAVPTLGNVGYAWGISRGAPTNCRVKSFSLTRVNFVFWDLRLELVESV